jgi:NitT/TauT family transport system permease protein
LTVPAEPKPGPTAPRRQNQPPAGLSRAFAPNGFLDATAMNVLIAGQVALALVFWQLYPSPVVPRPMEVLEGLRTLWFEQGLGRELIASLGVYLEALAITTAITLLLCYLTVMPFFRPIAAAVAKGRFLSMVGLSLLITLMLGGGRPLKVSMLVFGIGVFFVTSMLDVVASIPRDAFDHARTLRMSEWRTIWEVVVLGTADKALDALRQNAAIGWMMLSMVEGIVRSEGGIGAMLLNLQKHMRLSEVFAIQLLILVVGILQDYALGAIKRLLFPYAHLTLERR